MSFVCYADAFEKCTLFTLQVSKVFQFTEEINLYEGKKTLFPLHVQVIWCKCNEKCQFYYGLYETGASVYIFACMESLLVRGRCQNHQTTNIALL